MITFVLIAAVLVVVALAWLLPPLLRAGPSAADTDRTQLNLSMLRDQLADLEAERARGGLTPEQYAESKVELERRVLEETTANEERVAAGSSGAGKATAAIVAALVPVAAVVLYLILGDPGALDLQKRQASMAGGDHTKQPTAQDIEQMLSKLAQRLEKEPDNADGWAMLARSYYVLQRYPDAVRAYENLVRLVPQEPAVLADYADALAMKNGRKIAGEPLKLVMQALQIDPAQPKALAMAGTEAFDRQDFKQAVVYWEKLRASVPPESEMAQNIEGSINEARTRGNLGGVAAAPVAKAPPAATQATPGPVAQAAAPVVGGASVQGTVKLAAAVAAKAAPTDTVFVFARAAEGPRVPLAVLRVQAKDLPAQFTLDDTLAMAPQFKLSNFKNVLVSARISKTGNATASPGDLEAQGVPVNVGARDVVITIDRVVP